MSDVGHPLHEVVTHSCSRDEAGELGEIFFQLAAWLEKFFPDVAVATSGTNQKNFLPADWQKIKEALEALPKQPPDGCREAIKRIAELAK